jgi:hypothetical protein
MGTAKGLIRVRTEALSEESVASWQFLDDDPSRMDSATELVLAARRRMRSRQQEEYQN